MLALQQPNGNHVEATAQLTDPPPPSSRQTPSRNLCFNFLINSGHSSGLVPSDVLFLVTIYIWKYMFAFQDLGLFIIFLFFFKNIILNERTQ